MPNYLKIWCRSALLRRWPPHPENDASICSVPDFGYHCQNEFSFYLVMFHINENYMYLKLFFVDTNIHMYVPFCKSVDYVTIWLSLRYHFWPRLKKILWSITWTEGSSAILRSRVVCRSSSARPSLTFHIFDFSSEAAERNSTKLG